MSFLQFIKLNWPDLLALTREHIFLVAISTGAAIATGVPLGILLTRVKGLQTPILGFANVMQTVPSLALFGLLIPIPFIGGIGARTAIIALALYGLLPIIRNTVTGIQGIDPRTSEAAVAIGMTGTQRLRMVELPLAAPVILTGIRVAVVIAVGVATVAAAVGAGGLGTYIFRGLRQNDDNLLLAGAVSAALLALLLDLALGQLQKAYEIGRRDTGLPKAIAAAVMLVLASAVGLSYLVKPTSAETGTAANSVVVGSKDFTESVILAEILSQLLEERGVTVTRQFELGGNLAHDVLISGNVDVYPEYTGTAYTAILKHPPVTDTEAVYDQTKSEYAAKFGLIVGPPLGFSNDFAILVRGDVARKNNLKTISDAVPVSKNWQAGFGQDFMSRADGYEGFRKAYGFSFAKQPREMDLSLTYRALAAGELDIIAGNSTDGLITSLDLYQLQDDRHYFPPYQAIFIARSGTSVELNTVLTELGGKISTDDMRKLNYGVDGEHRTARDVAAQWIASHRVERAASLSN